VSRKWKEAHDANITIEPFDVWVRKAVHDHPQDPNNNDDMDRILLCSRPSQKTTRYTRMRAFGNHFRVEDSHSAVSQTYDSGVASIFEMPIASSNADVSLNYVGVLQDILKLDYGPLRTPIILLRCEWLKREDNRGNPTYVRDDAGFMVVNFRHKLPKMSEPFIFPSQATQVFFSNDLRKPGWKVVLRKEARSRREEQDTSNVFITTSLEVQGMSPPDRVPPPPIVVSLVGAIELSEKDNMLARAKFRR
jgi:hypothetical protein